MIFFLKVLKSQFYVRDNEGEELGQADLQVLPHVYQEEEGVVQAADCRDQTTEPRSLQTLDFRKFRFCWPCIV